LLVSNKSGTAVFVANIRPTYHLCPRRPYAGVDGSLVVSGVCVRTGMRKACNVTGKCLRAGRAGPGLACPSAEAAVVSPGPAAYCRRCARGEREGEGGGATPGFAGPNDSGRFSAGLDRSRAFRASRRFCRPPPRPLSPDSPPAHATLRGYARSCNGPRINSRAHPGAKCTGNPFIAHASTIGVPTPRHSSSRFLCPPRVSNATASPALHVCVLHVCVLHVCASCVCVCVCFVCVCALRVCALCVCALCVLC
jgi:hypothetical protein